MLPSPRERLADCMWLPRFLAKARQMQAGELPPDYAARFCAPDSVDHYFLAHFALSKDDALDAVRLHPEAADFGAWFQRLPTAKPEHVAQWNALAEQLGRPGFPMAERFNQIRPTLYARLENVETIFDLIEGDEWPAGS